MKRVWIDRDAYNALKDGELFLEAKGESPIQVVPVDVGCKTTSQNKEETDD